LDTVRPRQGELSLMGPDGALRWRQTARV